jgi:hypothetical protein
VTRGAKLWLLALASAGAPAWYGQGRPRSEAPPKWGYVIHTVEEIDEAKRLEPLVVRLEVLKKADGFAIERKPSEVTLKREEVLAPPADEGWELAGTLTEQGTTKAFIFRRPVPR